MRAHHQIIPADSGVFTISGSTITAPNSQTFVPLGANVAYYRYMTPNYAYDPLYSAVGKSSAALEWGWNTIRIPVGFGDDFNLLDQLIVEYTAKKIVCIIDCHELWRDEVDGAKGVNSARITQLDNFWQTMSDKYKNNTYVWFNLHNEPPLDGTAWTDLHIRHAQLVRQAGAQNIIVCDSPSGALDRGSISSWDPTMLPAVIAAANGNVMLSTHDYWNRWCDEMLDTYSAGVQAVAPLMIGEFGYNINEGQPTSAGEWDSGYLAATAVMNSYHRHGVGVTMWLGAGGTDTLGLKQNSDSFWTGGADANLAGLGPRLWAIGHGVNTNTPIAVNWISNPCAVAVAPSDDPDWRINPGDTLASFRTGQSWATGGTTTDAVCSTSNYLTYDNSGAIASMPAGTYAGSCSLYAPSAGSFQIRVRMLGQSYQDLNQTATTTVSVSAGANVVNFSFNKPAATRAIPIDIVPVGYAGGQNFAVTNLTTNSADGFFSGATTDTSSTFYCWSGEINNSPSAKTSKFIA